MGAFDFDDFSTKFLVLVTSLLIVYVGYTLDTKTEMSVDHAMEVGSQFTFTLLAVVMSVFFASSVAEEINKKINEVARA